MFSERWVDGVDWSGWRRGMGRVEMNFRDRSSKVSLREEKVLRKREESRMSSTVLSSTTGKSDAIS